MTTAKATSLSLFDIENKIPEQFSANKINCAKCRLLVSVKILFAKMFTTNTL